MNAECASGQKRQDGRFAFPIWAKLVSLTAAGLISLVLSAWYFTSALHETSNRAERMQALIQVVEEASEAHVAFGKMRYWLTDLSVSLLVASERNADLAREKLDSHLSALAAHDANAVEEIRRSVDAYAEKALEAADAYTDDRRVIGNTFLAEARGHSAKVDSALDSLVREATESAKAERRVLVEAAEAFAQRATLAVVVMVGAGLLLTALVLRSIVQPLKRVNDAIGALMRGHHDVALPPEGPDELGAMAKTLRLFRESVIERERLEAETERQGQRLVTAIETIPDGFVLYDAETRIVLANSKYRDLFPEIATMVQPGVKFVDLMRALIDSRKVDLEGMSAEDWIQGRLDLHLDPHGFMKDRQYGDVWLRIVKRQTPDGGTVAVYTDITTLKQREEALEVARRDAESANEAKSQFLASMSHELRTPLNAIIGYSEMLIEEAVDLGQDAFVPDLEKVASAGRHLLMLINDILDLSKIEAGKMEVFVETFDVDACLQSVQDTIQPLVDKNSNRLVLQIDGALGSITSDQTKIRQNLFNLLSNAAKFTENGAVTLAASRATQADGDWLTFSVSDTGIGMTEEQAAKLFTAFTQADASTTRNYGGTGLGLSISKSFCEMIGGRISVMSEPGVGSTFTMTIPAVCPIPEAKPSPAVASETPSSARDVLVIDDNPDARALIAAALRDAGFAYREAESGPKGIAAARAERPRAIILDIIMPGQDGWSVLKTLKSDPELCEIPVILATVLADRDMGMALGAVEYLTKPVDANHLIETIKAVGSSAKDVLVIDDDLVSRNLMRRILTKQGLNVHEANNGERGLAQMLELRPQLVFLDLMMPGMDGFEVLAEMQRSAELSSIPVIVVSSKDLSRSELAWLRDHAVSIVAKDANSREHLVEALKKQIPDLDQAKA